MSRQSNQDYWASKQDAERGMIESKKRKLEGRSQQVKPKTEK